MEVLKHRLLAQRIPGEWQFSVKAAEQLAPQADGIQVMSENNASNDFLCNSCKHHIPSREDSRKIICPLTLGFHDGDNVASCEFAERDESISFLDAGAGYLSENRG